MKRTQLQLDEVTYEELRRRAFEQGVSMSSLVRRLLRDCLGLTPARSGMDEFSFVASGRSEQGSLAPVSERHDEALAEDYAR